MVVVRNRLHPSRTAHLNACVADGSDDAGRSRVSGRLVGSWVDQSGREPRVAHAAGIGRWRRDCCLWFGYLGYGHLAGCPASLDGRLGIFVARPGALPGNDDMALLSGRFASRALFSATNRRGGPGLSRVEVFDSLGYAILDVNPAADLSVVFYNSTPNPP
jgi:hypothetical protein